MIRLPFADRARGSGGPRITTAAAPIGVRGPSSPPVPEAPWFVARAPSEPQGPSLPAGPPRLLLRVEGGKMKVRHCPGSVPDPPSRCKPYSLRLHSVANIHSSRGRDGPHRLGSDAY